LRKDTPLPFGEQEIIAIANQRAIDSIQEQKADYAVGFCEGVIQNDQGYFTAVWCVVVTATGKRFLGGGMHVLLSGQLLQKLSEGILRETDIESYLQKNFTASYQQLVEFALLPVSQP
jgi:non-canonical (house-cleaning) NTP pyrophosphatase